MIYTSLGIFVLKLDINYDIQGKKDLTPRK